MLITVTPPGRDVLRYGPDSRILARDAGAWNRTASKRWARLYKMASLSADRYVGRLGKPSVMPRQIGNAWAAQQRGAWHIHLLLPAGSEIERAWSRHVVRVLDRAWREDKRRWTAEERRGFVGVEDVFGRVQRGFYGFGFVDRNPARRSRSALGSAASAGYLARNAAGYVGRNATVPGFLEGRPVRLYMSRRLTSKTGVTIRNLRRARWLFVRARQGVEPLKPPTWTLGELAIVLSLLGGNPLEGAARAP